HRLPGGVDHPLGFTDEMGRDRRDAIALHCDVGGASGRAAPVDDRAAPNQQRPGHGQDRKSTRLNSSHVSISYAVFCLKKNRIYDTLSISEIDAYKNTAFPASSQSAELVKCRATPRPHVRAVQSKSSIQFPVSGGCCLI